MRTRGRILALALLAVPAALLAQQGAPPAGTGTNPIERVLQRRSELALTGDQVQELEAIRQKNAAHEKELVGKITAARGVAPGVPMRTQATTPAERQALWQKTQAVRPRMQELRQLHLQQIQEARSVLTAEQNAKAWAFEGRGRGRGGVGPGMMRPGAGRGMRGTGMGPRGGW